MRNFIYFLSFVVLLGCSDQPSEEVPVGELSIAWGVTQNHMTVDPSYQEAFFILDDPNAELGEDWEIRFNGFLSQVTEVEPGYRIENITGEYWKLTPGEGYQPLNGSDTIHYRIPGTRLKETMSPKGFFLVKDGLPQAIEWSQLPMTRETTFGRLERPGVTDYGDPGVLFDRYPEVDSIAAAGPSVIPAPVESSLLTDSPIDLGSFEEGGDNRLHVWYSGALWYRPMNVFRDWLGNLYGIELVRHGEEKPDLPHLELIFDNNLSGEAYEIFNMGPELTVISAGNAVGMQHGLATVVQSLRIDGGRITLPLERVIDSPRFGYRGLMLDVSRNFHSRESVLRLLDLMALYKYNKFHFHLTDDEGWRLEIPGLPELTTVGATRGYTPGEEDRLHPAYGSGPDPTDPYGSGFYSVEEFIEIVKFADERNIEVIPEFDLPGHARAAIIAMEAYARRTGNRDYALIDPDDASVYRSVQDYPDNTINVCQESTYNFLEKVIGETATMFDSAGVKLQTLHTGGDEVAGGVWTASPVCADWLARAGVDDENPEVVKNALAAYFLGRFTEILSSRDIRTAGWEEIAMEREADANGNYRYVVNPDLTDANLLPYVWNSLGDNLTLSYELANAGYDVVVCNVTNLYFDLAYNTDPAEPGLYWGGFVDTYSPWALAPFDLVKTVPTPWYQDTPTSEAEWRRRTVALRPEARDRILGLQGQLWSETVRGAKSQDYYLWPKMLGLAERAWSPAANWEAIEEKGRRQEDMVADWAAFATRVGHFALPLLDRYAGGEGVNYRLPPAGGKIEGNKLTMKTQFPGLNLYYKIDNGEEQAYSGPVEVPEGATIQLYTGAGDRRSRATRLQ